MYAHPWADERGFTLPELMVAALVGAVMLLGMFSLYRATTTSFNQSSSQAYLQRQGTLALQEITRQAQRATKPISVQAAPGCAPAGTTGRSLQLQVSQTVPASIPAAEVGYYCYWAGNGANGPAGALCEGFSTTSSPTGSCRDLLAGASGLLRQTGQTRVTLALQPDPRCPKNMTNPPGTPQALGVPIAAGVYCLALDRDTGSTKGDVAFAITDGLDGMTFSASLMLRN